MITRFEIKCYPGTQCEHTVLVSVGTHLELFGAHRSKHWVDGVLLDDANGFGYKIQSLDDDREYGHDSYMNCEDKHDAMATALLRAAAGGNGGFPLERKLR